MTACEEQRRRCVAALRNWQRTAVARRPSLASLARQLNVPRSTLTSIHGRGIPATTAVIKERSRLRNSAQRFSSCLPSAMYAARTVRSLRSDGREPRRLARYEGPSSKREASTKTSFQ